jgi:hypothetical protein
MKKRLTHQQKKEQAVVDLINKMFEIAGHNITYEDIKGRQDAWYTEWTMTTQQNEEWMEWGRKYLQNHLKMYSKAAKKEMSMVALMWGLKLSDFSF